MGIFEAIILGVVEGVTEFLPVSSTGHLILASELLKITQTNFVKSFEIGIQLGAILAVVFLYRDVFLTGRQYWLRIFWAFLPTAVLGLLFYKIVKQFLLGSGIVTVLALFTGGVALILLEKIYQKRKSSLKEVTQMSLKKAFLIGIFQSVSIIPGVSRSGATIIGGLFLGLKRETAAEFSFLLAVPTMLAATVLDLTKNGTAFTKDEYLLALVGFAAAFITAIFTIQYFLSYLKKHDFILFGVYRIVLAILFWLFVLKPAG